MLAYAFWHWKRPEVSADSYESHQRAFQTALARQPPSGFGRATTVRLQGAPWAAQGKVAYEDWYLVGGMADLEGLNEAAVTASRQAPHDAVARLAEGGTAGLYRLASGTPPSMPRGAVWFSKPAGMSYAALRQALEPMIAATGSALWMRQMVLGPAPEFCVQSPTRGDLPPPFSGLSLVLEPVFPAGS